MGASYEYSVGSVRTKEKYLLSKQDIELLIASKSTKDMCSLLKDKGYAESSDNDVDLMLKEKKTELWNYLKHTAPDFSDFTCFLYLNDLHNIKVSIKGILRNRQFDSFMLSPCTVSHKVIINAVKGHDFKDFPEWISGAVEEAYSVLAETGDTPLCDAILDTACMLAMLSKVKEQKSQLLTEYVNTLVFLNNVKVAIRASITGKNSYFIDRAICPMQDINLETWKKAILQGEKETVSMLEKLSQYSCSEGIKYYKKSPSLFEKWTDDILISIVSKAKYVALGKEPLIAYLIAQEAEIKTIHIIASGIRAGQDQETIRERLRKSYV